VEQKRAARKAGPNRAAFGHAAKHLLYTHSSTAVTSAAEGSTAHQHRHYKPTRLALIRCLSLAALLPELGNLRRKESSAELKAKAEKTSAATHFDYPGAGILANEDARKFMETKEQHLRIGTQGNAHSRNTQK
jgi:hypothetical protein